MTNPIIWTHLIPPKAPLFKNRVNIGSQKRLKVLKKKECTFAYNHHNASHPNDLITYRFVYFSSYHSPLWRRNEPHKDET